MRKLALNIGVFILLAGILGSVSAQEQPRIEIVLSKNTASQNEVINADVFVRGPANIVGADIGIEVDGQCLKVEGRENGQYLPTTAEESGFVPFEETTDTGTRLAASVIGRDVVAKPDQYFFRVPIRIVCSAGEAAVRVTFAQIVDDELTTYKLEDQQLTTTAGLVTIVAGPLTQPDMTDTLAAPEPTTGTLGTPIPTVLPAVEEPEDEGDNIRLLLLIVVVGIAAIALITLAIIVWRRSKRRQ